MPAVPMQLGARRGLSYGLQLPPELRRQQEMPTQAAPQDEPPSIASALGRSTGASMTPTVESGSVIEALAAALEGGLHGRAAYGAQQQQEGDNAIARALQVREQKREDASDARAQESHQSDLAAALSEQQNPEVWSEPFDFNGTQVQRNSRDNQYRTVSPPMSPAFQLPQPGMPVQGAAGYVWGPNGTQVPAEGGPADRRVNQEQAQRARAALSRLEDQQNVVSAIDRALELAGSGETGAVGAVMRGVPGTRAFDLDAQLDIIRANIGFDALMEMRANSPTGGALGAVTERELNLLQSVLESLNQAQSQEQFVAGLNRLKTTYMQSMGRIRAAYEQDFGGAPDGGAPAEGYAQEPTNDGTGAPAQRVLRWNPQTQQLE